MQKDKRKVYQRGANNSNFDTFFFFGGMAYKFAYKWSLLPADISDESAEPAPSSAGSGDHWRSGGQGFELEGAGVCARYRCTAMNSHLF